jgi:tetratricopeptide (TPR) repeat protein
MRHEVITTVARGLRAVTSKRVGLAFGLWGEAGIGKTHAAREVLREVPCQSASLQAALSTRAIAVALPRPRKLPVSAQQQLERLLRGEPLETRASVDAITAILTELAPFVLQLEDLHEASPEGLEWIVALSRAVTRTRGVGLLVTSRTEPPKPFRNHLLEPLEQAETQAMLEQQLGAALPDGGFEWIHARTRGNPLFGLEFLLYLTRQGSLWNDGTRWRWRRPADDFVPITVEALIEQVIRDATGAPELEAAMGARVMLDSCFRAELWATVSGLSPTALKDATAQLERRGLFRGDDFAHPLYREVAARLLTLEQRHVFAHRALEVLEADPQVAADFIEAAKLEPAEKRLRYERAALAAEESGRVMRAGRWLAQAVGYAHGWERGALAYRAAKYFDAVNPAETIRLLEIALQDNPNDSQAMIALASQYARTGLTAEMNRVLVHLPGDATTQASWIGSLIMIRYGHRDFEGVLQLWDEHPELHSHPDARMVNCIGFARMELGDPQGAEALVGPALQASNLTPAQRCNLLVVRGLARRLTGDLEAARSFMDEAVHQARISQQPVTLASALHNRQVVLGMLGLLPEMVTDLGEAIELYRNAGFTLKYGSSLGQLGVTLWYLGQYEAAEVKLLEAHDILTDFLDSSFLVTCECNLCSLYLDWRPPHALQLAGKYAQLALHHARKNGIQDELIMASRAISHVATASGQAQRGLALAEECLSLDHTSVWTRIQSLQAKGMALEALGLKTEAICSFEDAREIAVGSQVQIIQFELSRLNNDLESGRVLLEGFRQCNQVAVVNHALRKWPELALGAGELPVVQAEDRVSARLEVLGLIRLQRDGQTLTYRGRKRSEILAYLLEARISGRMEVGTLELLDVFYPDEPEPDAKNTLRQQMHLIRSNLGPQSVLSTASGYALGAVSSDAEDFLKTGDPSLWRDSYLTGLGDGWLSSVREALTLALRSKLEDLLESDAKEAARLGQILCQMEPYDPDALRLGLLALRASGDDRAASRLFNQQRDHLLAVDEHIPRSLEVFLSGMTELLVSSDD